MRGAVIASAAAVALGVGIYAASSFLMGDRAGAARIALGRTVYDANCAACHGAKLEGQPDWQTPLPSGRLPAPPHDATGHTWHHPDELLLAIIRFGTAAVVGNGYQSDMPGFEGRLTADEMTAALDYIKSTWPEREAAMQRKVSGR